MYKQPRYLTPAFQDRQAIGPAAFCCWCGNELYPGEQAYCFDGCICCTECLPAYARSYFLPACICLKGPRS